MGNYVLLRPWFFLLGGLMAIWSLFLLQEEGPYWPLFGMLLLGAACLALSFGERRPLQVPPAEANAGAGPPPAEPDLRRLLHDLDQMLADRVVSAAEHKRKRAALLDAWGGPGA